MNTPNTIRVRKSNPLYLWKLACLAVAVLLFCVVGGGAFTLVWMRQEVARSAQTLKGFERELAEARRIDAHLQARIAQEQQPEALKRRSAANLLVPGNRQFVYVAPAQVLRTRAEFNYQPIELSIEIAYNPTTNTTVPMPAHADQHRPLHQ